MESISDWLERVTNQTSHMKLVANAIDELPIDTLHQCHCKQLPNGQLEMPSCCICLVDMELGDSVMFLPCGHVYHQTCVRKALKTDKRCP